MWGAKPGCLWPKQATTCASEEVIVLQEMLLCGGEGSHEGASGILQKVGAHSVVEESLEHGVHVVLGAVGDGEGDEHYKGDIVVAREGVLDNGEVVGIWVEAECDTSD